MVNEMNTTFICKITKKKKKYFTKIYRKSMKRISLDFGANTSVKWLTGLHPYIDQYSL